MAFFGVLFGLEFQSAIMHRCLLLIAVVVWHPSITGGIEVQEIMPA